MAYAAFKPGKTKGKKAAPGAKGKDAEKGKPAEKQEEKQPADPKSKLRKGSVQPKMLRTDSEEDDKLMALRGQVARRASVRPGERADQAVRQTPVSRRIIAPSLSNNIHFLPETKYLIFIVS